MGNLQIKNIPPDVHDELRRRAAQRDVTIRDYVLDLIQRDQLRATTRDWLDSLSSREPVEVSVAETLALIDEGRRERDERWQR